MSQTTRYLIVNSHPIQYFAPLYRAMAATPDFDVTVLYCSRHGLDGEVDRQFGAQVQWDIPLLEGYQYRFLSNQSWRPAIYGFWGLLNLSVIGQLWRAKRSVVVVYGWAYAVCWITILFARLFGHTVCLRAESPLTSERLKRPWQQHIRRWVLGHGLFKLVNYFLYIGKQNQDFYAHMGVPVSKLVYTPYAVDNARFQKEAQNLRPQRKYLREQLGISSTHQVLLYCGKYIPKKRPLDLLQAVVQLQRTDLAVVLMGDGELRAQLETFIHKHNVPNVHLTGFVNQTEIGRYFAISDFFVMCSGHGETWGLAANEAMNFGLPVLIANAVGCASDLVVPQVTGDTYPSGNVEALICTLTRLLALSSTQRNEMSLAAQHHIDQYSYSTIISNLRDTFCPLSMNIIVIGRNLYESLEWHLADAFSRLGHHACVLDPQEVSVLPEKAQYWLARFYEPYDQYMSRRLVDAICDKTPDFVLVVYRHMHPSVIKGLKDRLPDCPVAQYNPDALTNLERQQIIASPFDFYFTKEPYMAEIFRLKAGMNIFYQPEAFNPIVNIQPDESRIALEEAVDIDVLLYGNMYPYRSRMVEQLQRAGIRLTIFGHPASYMPDSVKAAFQHQYLTGKEKNRLIVGARIVFNNFHYAEVTSANKKYFEINGLGGFQLSDYKPSLAEYSGVPVEAVTFNTIDEAIDKIRYYLPRASERHSLAEQQCQHFRQYHTYARRVEEMLTIVLGSHSIPNTPLQ